MRIRKQKRNTLYSTLLPLWLLALLLGGSHPHASDDKRNTIPDTVSIDSQYAVYWELAPLEEAADIIVIAHTSQSIGERNNVIRYWDTGGIEYFYTETKLAVEKVVKAPSDLALKEGDSFDVLETFAYTTMGPRQKLRMDDYIELRQNSRYALFLKKNTSGQYYIMNRNEGKFNLDGTDADDLATINMFPTLWLNVYDKYAKLQ